MAKMSEERFKQIKANAKVRKTLREEFKIVSFNSADDLIESIKVGGNVLSEKK